MRIVIFLGIIQLILFIVHYVVYRASVETLPLGVNGRFYLGAALALLSVTFILSNLASMYSSNFLSSAFYLVSVFWLGTLFFLFWASVAVGGVSLINSLVGFRIPLQTVSAIIFCTAFALSIYATVHSFSIKKVFTEVQIPNLPSNWHDRKVAFFADSHFGNVRGKGLAEKIVEVIQSEKPDLILIAGDIFDGPKMDTEEIGKALFPLSKMAPVFFVTGNHEQYGDKDAFIKALTETANMKLLSDEKVILNGLTISGLEYQAEESASSTQQALARIGINPSEPTILLKHVPLQIQEIANAGASLSLHGHTHRGQLFPFSLLTKRIYKGYDYGQKKFGPLTVYTTSGAGTWGPPQRLGTQSEIVFITLKQIAQKFAQNY